MGEIIQAEGPSKDCFEGEMAIDIIIAKTIQNSKSTYSVDI